MKHKLWYSFLSREEFSGDSPVFYTKDKLLWSKRLEESYDDIYLEFITYLKKEKNLEAYFNQLMVDKKDAWKTIPLMAWGVSFYNNQKKFPKTMSVLSQIPGLVSVSFNLLEPHSTIVPHFGDTNAIMRCHYGLEIPESLPTVGFKVKEESRSWENGKMLAFCDGYIHSAWNHSDKPRFILLFDVILPEFIPKTGHICSSVLSSLFLQSTASRLNLRNEPPRWILHSLFYSAQVAAYLSKPIYNFIGMMRYGK